MNNLTKSQIEERRIKLGTVLNELVYLDPRSEVERTEAIKYMGKLITLTEEFNLWDNAPQSFIELCFSRYTEATDKFRCED
jgi:hypothetical protein